MGIGLEYNKVGLIRFDQSQSSYKGKTGFVLPVASIGFHFWRGYNPAEINIKYGHTAPAYFSYDRNGDSIRDATNGKITQGKGQGRVIKVTMSQILNY